MNCWSCGHSLGDIGKIGFRDECPRCASPLHCCRNCKFYDPGYHNQCREPMAERVVDKERANFCEFFAPAPDGQHRAKVEKADVREKLEKLFKKRSP